MDMNLVVEILGVVALVVVGFLATYLKGKSEFIGQIAGLIAHTEQMYKDYTGAGSLKMNYVISMLYAKLPSIVKTFVKEDTLRELVQQIFDRMEEYAKLQLDKVVDKATDKLEEVSK